MEQPLVTIVKGRGGLRMNDDIAILSRRLIVLHGEAGGIYIGPRRGSDLEGGDVFVSEAALRALCQWITRRKRLKQKKGVA